jgi:hypothetical protein
MRRLLLALGLVLLTACGGSTEVRPMVEQTPSTISMADARDIYLRAVEPANRAAAEFQGAVAEGEGINLPRVTAAAGSWAEQLREWNTIMVNTAWPAEVQPTAADLAGSLAALTAACRQMAAATDEVEFAQGAAAAQAADFPTHVELMRTRLGLPAATAPPG